MFSSPLSQNVENLVHGTNKSCTASGIQAQFNDVMLTLKCLREQKQQQQAATAATGNKKKVTAAQLRVQKGMRFHKTTKKPMSLYMLSVANKVIFTRWIVRI